MINKKYLKLIVLILLLFISIGFAYLTSSLVINGLIGYKGNSWNIYFDNVNILINDVNGSKPTINNDKDTVNFSISFSEPGEVYKFSVEVVNEGTIDAMLSEILKTGITSSNSSYLDYTVKYSDDTELNINDGVRAGSKIRLNVEVKYKYETEELAPTGSQDFSIKLTYVQAGDNANFKNALIKPDNNNVFTLNNVKSNSLNNLKIYGNTEQTTYTGQNLFNRDDRSDVSNLVTYLDDDWVTISYDNSSGTSNKLINFFTNNLDISIDTNYRIVFEVKNVSGNCIFYLTSIWNKSETEIKGQFSTKSYNLADLENGYFEAYTAKSRNIENTQDGLRTYLLLAPGESGSITFRISVLKDLNVTADNFIYEPYVGGEAAPNPNYPQNVNNVTGNSTLKITGKNLFKGSFNSRYFNNQVPTTYNTRISINSFDYNNINFTINGNYYLYIITDVFQLKKNTTYTISFNRTNTKTQNCRFYIYYVTDDNDYSNFNRFFHEEGQKTHTFTTTGSGKIAFAWGGDNTFAGVTMDIANIQLEEGETATEYEAYQEHVYPITLGNIELNKIGDTQDYIYYDDVLGKWMIHREIEKEQLTSDHTFTINTSKKYLSFLTLKSKKISGITASTPVSEVPLTVYSNYFLWADLRNVNSNNDTRVGFFDNGDTTTIRVRHARGTITINDLKTWLQDKNVLFYYRLNAPYNEEITDTTLLGQLDAIKSSNLFNGVNHVYFDSSVNTSISFDYIEE